MCQLSSVVELYLATSGWPRLRGARGSASEMIRLLPDCLQHANLCRVNVDCLTVLLLVSTVHDWTGLLCLPEISKSTLESQQGPICMLRAAQPYVETDCMEGPCVVIDAPMSMRLCVPPRM